MVPSVLVFDVSSVILALQMTVVFVRHVWQRLHAAAATVTKLIIVSAMHTICTIKFTIIALIFVMLLQQIIV